MYWRKIIPHKLFEYEGNINQIIERHNPNMRF